MIGGSNQIVGSVLAVAAGVVVPDIRAIPLRMTDLIAEDFLADLVRGRLPEGLNGWYYD
jgi:hypothetical protein